MNAGRAASRQQTRTPERHQLAAVPGHVNRCQGNFECSCSGAAANFELYCTTELDCGSPKRWIDSGS